MPGILGAGRGPEQGRSTSSPHRELSSFGCQVTWYTVLSLVCTTTRRATIEKSPPTIHTPPWSTGGDNPHPLSDRGSRNPHPPRNTSPCPRRWPALAFPRLPLGLGHVSRYFEGRKGNDGKGSTGSTGGGGGLVTAIGRTTGMPRHAPKSRQCRPREVTDFAPSSGIYRQTTAGC